MDSSNSGAQADLNDSGDSALPRLETLGKDEAAQFLGVSSRALERYTASGRVAVGYAPGKTRSVAVYERAELERLKSELQRPLLRGAAVATSGAIPGVPVTSEQTPTSATATPTSATATPTEAVQSQAKNRQVWDGQTKDETSTNSDSPSDAVSDELVAVPPGTSGGGETALDALTQLVLERLLERLQGEAGIAVALGSSGAGSTSASTSAGSSMASTALVLAPAGALTAKFPQVALGEKPLLTLPEAAALTGLSRAFLKSAIAGGTLVAKPIGRLWRVKRGDLDAFIAAL